MKQQQIQQTVRRAIKASPSRHKILRVRLFGSQLHGDARPNSDVDLLVDFRQPLSIGLFELIRIEQELSEALGAPVDLIPTRSLSKYIRDTVLEEAKTVYE